MNRRREYLVRSKSMYSKTFDAVGTSTWVVPPGCTAIEYIEIFSAAGGGAGGTNGYVNGHSGGAGSHVDVYTNVSVTPGESITVVVAAGRSSPSYGSGYDGALSSFSTYQNTRGASGGLFDNTPEGSPAATGYWHNGYGGKGGASAEWAGGNGQYPQACYGKPGGNGDYRSVITGITYCAGGGGGGGYGQNNKTTSAGGTCDIGSGGYGGWGGGGDVWGSGEGGNGSVTCGGGAAGSCGYDSPTTIGGKGGNGLIIIRYKAY